MSRPQAVAPMKLAGACIRAILAIPVVAATAVATVASTIVVESAKILLAPMLKLFKFDDASKAVADFDYLNDVLKPLYNGAIIPVLNPLFGGMYYVFGQKDHYEDIVPLDSDLTSMGLIENTYDNFVSDSGNVFSRAAAKGLTPTQTTIDKTINTVIDERDPGKYKEMISKLPFDPILPSGDVSKPITAKQVQAKEASRSK